MEFGVTIFPTAETISVAELARACEDLGFESLFLPEHSHIPVQRESQYAPGAGTDLDADFYRAFDPLIALAAAASVTSVLRVGTGLCLAAQRDPILLAKEVSTLDVLSKGRVIFGVGPGWNREEMANHGVDPRFRHRILEEHVDAMKVIWTSERAEFHGTYVNFDPIFQWPKPYQDPYPPVLIGGNGPKVLRRVVDHGDGWLASATREDKPSIRARVRELNELADEHERGELPVTVQRAEASRADLEFYEDSGVRRCTFGLPAIEAKGVLDILRDLASMVRAFNAS